MELLLPQAYQRSAIEMARRRLVNLRRGRRLFGLSSLRVPLSGGTLEHLSYRVHHPSVPLQWVQREKDLDGIRYFSTKLAAMDKAQNRAFNFVFPVRHKAPRGICSGLQNSFALTPPVSWPMLQSWQPKIMDAQLPAPGAFDLAEGFPVAYSDTEFFALEHKLKGGLIATKIVGG